MPSTTTSEVFLSSLGTAPPGLCLEELEAAICTLRAIHPRVLQGSRVGRHTDTRALLLALAQDLLLLPASSCGRAYGLTRDGARRAARHGRRLVVQDPLLRLRLTAQLSCLGIRFRPSPAPQSQSSSSCSSPWQRP